MTKMAEAFQLDTLLDQLQQFHLAQAEPFAFEELEWRLSDFIVHWGQRSSLDPAIIPSDQRIARLREFGQSNLPFFTASDFPNVQAWQVRVLGLAVASLNIYILLVDEIVDEPLTASADLKLALQPVLLHFYRLLNQLFPADSQMWDEIEWRLNRTAQMMAEEHRLFNGAPRPFSPDEFKRIGYGKMTFAPLQAIGLALLNGTPERIPNLVKCWNALAFAAIVRDDVLDWRKDYENGNYTFLIDQVLFSDPFRANVESRLLPETNEVMGALFCTDIIETTYQIAIEELHKVLGLADEIDWPALAGMIQQRYDQFKSKPQELLVRRMETLLNKL